MLKGKMMTMKTWRWWWW